MKKGRRVKTAAERAEKPRPARRRRRGLYVVGAIVVVGVAVWLLATRYLMDGSAAPGWMSRTPPNVLLVTLDTVRADHVGCYGYAEARTPAIDSLAASGVRFEQAYCQAPLTLPSHVAMLTGLYPPSTGVRINGAVALGPGVPTLAELFRDRGYRTGAFIGADVLDASYGLARGFGLYADDLGENDGLGLREYGQRRGDRVCDDALDWLSRERDKPFFAWVHFYDPHAPYDPPEEFREGVPSAYDGEIAFVDSQIQRLLSWLDENGLREQTLIIVVGDHGEGLQDHDEDAHGHFVYNSTVRVPLIVHFPARIDRPRTVSAPVQLVDLFPTVVELLDWKSPELALDGRSLAGALEKGEAPAESVYGESEYPLLGFGWAPLRYSVVDRWKYIDAPRAELYDLQADPDERTNVIEDHADVAEQMRSDLAELVSYLRENRPDVGSTTPDQETIERLASLGYVATTATPDDFDDDAERRDPKDMRYVVRGFEEGLSLHRRGDYQGAVEVLAPLVEQSPESGQLSALLGMSYVHLGRNAEAQRALEASIEQNPNNRRRWFALGVAHKNQNHLEDALACFKQAIALSPGWAQAQREAATALSMMHRMREAEPYWRSCVELDPSSAQCLTNLASMRLMARQPREAVPLLERALAVEPRNENTHRVLWKALMGSGRRTDALRALEKANELFPAVRAFSCPLAWYRATTPQTPRDELDRAIEWAKACCEAAPGNARNFDVLAAAYAASGDFRRAVETAQHAMQLVAGSGPENLRRAIEARLQLYRSGRPYVEAAPPAGNGGPSN